MAIEIEVIPSHFITICNATGFSKLACIGEEVDDHLRQTVRICVKPARLSAEIAKEIDTWFHSIHDRLTDVDKEGIDISSPHIEFHRSSLSLREIEDIADDLEQHLIVAFDDFNKFLFLSRIVGFCQHIGESNNSIKRSADFMAHICEESRF